jgi:hypothetical protein
VPDFTRFYRSKGSSFMYAKVFLVPPVQLYPKPWKKSWADMCAWAKSWSLGPSCSAAKVLWRKHSQGAKFFCWLAGSRLAGAPAP